MGMKQDSAQVRIPPPLLYLGALVVGFLLDWLLDVPRLGIDATARTWLGGLLFVSGMTIMVVAAGLFRQLGTNVKPWEPSTLLVTNGLFRWTRNPMYLGMTLAYLGVTLGFNRLTLLVILPIVLLLMQSQVIAKEERYLEAKFGEPYRAYKLRVRRWV